MNFKVDDIRKWAEELWADLRESNLAGIAIALGILLLVATASAVRSGGPLKIDRAPAAAPAGKQADVSFHFPGDKPLSISDIDASDPRNPFQSMDSLSTGSGDGSTSAGSDQVSVEDTVSALSTATPSSDPAQLQPIQDVPTTGTSPSYPGDDDTTDTADDGDTTSGGTMDTGKEPANSPVTDYSYTADVQFGEVSDLRRYATVQRLGLIPSRNLPLLMYLGVSTDHETAVFMVDSRLSQGGEGECVPRDSLCTFLELQPTPAHDEHHFRDADGKEYLLRLRGLTRTTASAGSLAGRDVSALQGSPMVVDGER